MLFQTLILVTGGCSGPCNETNALTSTEIYDPETNEWTEVASLPVPLYSAKMDLLDEIPTLIGGYDGANLKDNDIIYQYHVMNNTWTEFPRKLKVARSNPAVFQVPQSLFPKCIEKYYDPR